MLGAKSLGEIKEELARDLRKLRSPILVVLDDLDRLTPQEMLELFQLIKANADFPNLVYLILCDRNIVESNITKALNVPGRDYLEKIVQVAFDVPMIDIARVHKVLFQRLGSLLVDEGALTKFSKKRWGNVFLSGLSSYFMTLRDVNRLVSSLAFHFSSFSAGSVFEVNPIDLIVLETIRLFEPDVYRGLQSNKEILTTGRPEGRRRLTAEKAVQSIVEIVSLDRREQLTELIKHLFPTVEWALGGSQYASDYGEEWYRDLRVCSKKMFDRYFRLAVSEEELSQSSVQKLVRAFRDRESLRSELEALDSSGLLKAALEELAMYEDKLEPGQVEGFVTAIFDVADLLSDENRVMFEVPPSWRVAFLVRRAANKLSDTDTRADALVKAIHATAGLFVAVHFVALFGTPLTDSTEEALLPEAELTRLREAALLKIRGAAASGTLAEHPKLALLLSLWREWGSDEDVWAYIGDLTSTPQGTLRLLKSLLVRSHRQQLGDYVSTERYYMRRIDVERLISMDALDTKLQAVPTENLSEEDQRAVRAFQKAMEGRSAGRPDDDPFALD